MAQVGLCLLVLLPLALHPVSAVNTKPGTNPDDAPLERSKRYLYNPNSDPQGDPCNDYWPLDNHTRTAEYNHGNISTICDRSSSKYMSPQWRGRGWYRFEGFSGTRMLDHRPTKGKFSCGTEAPGYLVGDQPASIGEVTDAKVCFDWDNPCQWSTPVQIKKCAGDKFSYKLEEAPACSLRYCGTDVDTCTDRGCSSEFGGKGKCADFSAYDVDFANLAKRFDLSAGPVIGKCGHRNAEKKDCCHCLKNIENPTTPPDRSTNAPLPIRPHVLAIGGDSATGASATVEELGPDQISLSNLPSARWGHSAFLLYQSFEVLVCGGKSRDYRPQLMQSCITYRSYTFARTWRANTIGQLKHPRFYSASVTMPAPSGDLYILGGVYSASSSEILRRGSSTWTTGPVLRSPLYSACAAPINETYFVTIGGDWDHKKVDMYNTRTMSWSSWPDLAEGRQGHSCSQCNGKIVVAGGYSSNEYTSTTLIIDVTTGQAVAGPTMNVARAYFSMECLPGGQVLVMGGVTNDGYTNTTEQWATSLSAPWSVNSSLAMATGKTLFATVVLYM